MVVDDGPRDRSDITGADVAAPNLQHKSGKKVRSLAVNVRSGAIWSMASTLVLKISGIAITAIVARILNQHDFGVFAVANTVFVIVSAFGEFGISSCLARADLKVSDIAPTMWTVSLSSSLVIGGALVIFAEPIAASLGSADGAGPVRVMAIVMVLTGVAAVPTGQCVRDFKQDKIFLANVVSFIPSTVVLIVLARSGSGADAFAWSRVAGQFTSCVIVMFSVPRFYLPGCSRAALSILYRFGIPLAVANFIGYLLQNVDYALIGRLLGSVRLGTYVIAFNAASWSSSLLVGVLAAVAVSAFSRVRHDAQRLMGAMADGVRAVMLIAAPMCALEMVLARPLVIVLYGANWVAAAAPLAILTLYGLIFIVCLLFSQVLAAFGKSTFILVVQIIWLVVLIPAMIVGVKTHGIVGAAWAHIVVIVPVVLPCYLYALRRATGIHFNTLAIAALPPLVASAISGTVAWAVMAVLHAPLLQLLLGGAAGGILYLVLTAGQILEVMGRGKIRHPAVLRLMQAYGRLGRALGISSSGPRPRHAKWRLALLGLACVFVALACYYFVGISGHYGATDVASAARATTAAGAAQGGHSSAASPPAAPARGDRSKASPSMQAAPVSRSLGVTSAAAFGPDGLSDGDNPGIATRIVDVSTDQPWYSLWYATPQFGNLQSGTGILLDMGQTVTVSSVRLVLGAALGADVRVRVGDNPYPADLLTAASAYGVGGTVRLTATTPATGRYVLIWFTRLPPAAQGHYQVSVYSVEVDGTGGA